MTILNTEVGIQARDGVQISRVSLDTFWLTPSNITVTDVFDPKVLYDPLSGRWLATCDADRRSATSSVLFAISDSDDPTGMWTHYQFDADATDIDWSDYPGIGVNSTWIAITNNMFSVNDDTFNAVKLWVIDKATALTGGMLTITEFNPGFDWSSNVFGFTMQPCQTFDANQPDLYIIDRSSAMSSGNPLIRISRLTGTGTSPNWSVLPGGPFPGTGLFAADFDFNFSQIDADQPDTATTIETNDPRMLNAVYRNGRIWCTHSAGLPAFGTVDRTVVAWYEFYPASSTPLVQSQLIDGGAGVHHYFPSITANCAGDVCIGFTRSSSSLYAEAVYTGRLVDDTPGTTRSITVAKTGEDSYIKDFGSGRVRWGDYSATVVDPLDDLSFWTIQEYAALDVGPAPSNDRWGTWWAKIGSTCLPEIKILASDGASEDKFGISVSVSSDVVIVGAYLDEDNGIDTGSAYVFRFNGSIWEEEQKLLASDGAASDRFGVSVSVSGDVAIVGAYYDDNDNGIDAGSAYVFRFNGSIWEEEQKLLASDSRSFYFGTVVSISGDVAIVGRPWDYDNGIRSGSAYVYRFNGSLWEEEQKLLASDGAADDRYGSVSVSGDVAIVGAHQDDDNGTRSGSAYVYRFNGSLWEEEQKLLASDGTVEEFFGWSVSVHGDIAIVGAVFDDDNGFRSGSAYVYRFNGSLWEEEQKLLASDGTADDWFGISVSISGDFVIVGAIRHEDNGIRSGSAYVYRFNGSLWEEEQKLLASDGTVEEFFGWSVSVHGDIAIVGAHQDDDNGIRSGSAYVYQLNCNTANPAICPADTDGSGDVNVTDLLAMLASWGPNPGHVADINGDGNVNVTDLLALLAAWGPC